ncbi:uncharacterized protein LOC104583759 isoform X3 [Brachypodium distachyon]|uniref:Uncharacterized protein n=1 Tax=Brachypodium distachyon TaxID=15368 RepID=I1I9L7_BRADI|nr:uncharacterized protein LOC104583759 isoform X3 [Brachypodium distachyon]KQJ99434.1 hypothetical protein BRADI_3g43230v3 [Brachypodium distachyon]|eukprot:XP_003574959.1 uncharacterized protein LOC104583759 isoform X3 [Brachypodium distachyon]
MTMTSEDGDISALLSEPSLPEEEPEASGSDDFLPAILESIKSNEKAVELSPEEVAWADSCFVHTSELSDIDWGAMRGALLDSLEKPVESPYGTSEVTQHGDVDMEERGKIDDDEAAREVCKVVNLIRGADEHGKQMDGYVAKSEDGDDLVSSEVVEQPESRDSIFKVWDLNVSFSDDEGELELINDMKELLRDNPPEVAYPPPSDSANALSQINIDELVAGLGDLSLQQTSE